MIILQRARVLVLVTGLAALLSSACAHGTAAHTTPVREGVAHVPPAIAAPAAQAAAPAAPAAPAKVPPAELFEVARVVDGDTIWVQRNGKVEKLRLLSVDTEELISAGSARADSTKPPTVFGEECALWAREFFAALAEPGQPARVGLAFPGGSEKRDLYGRLLCDVILPDGTNFNLMLVETGKSPYFTKYGWSEIDHAAYVAAQKQAQARKIGIWDPKTNMPKTPGVPAAKRPYERLLPWWDARGLAVESFRKAASRAGSEVCDTEDPEALARAARAGGVIACFGEIFRVKDQEDGSALVHFRASGGKNALVVRVPQSVLAQPWPFDLRSTAEEFHQNYVWLQTRVEVDPRGGFRAVSEDPKAWRLAGPEPRLP